MNRIKNLRRFALLAIIVAGSLTLAACNSSSKVPYGSLSEDNVYLTFGDYTVNEKELYDQFRIQAASVLSTMIEKDIFADYIAQAEAKIASGDADTLEYFYDQINTAIFGETDEESLQDLYDNNNDIYVRSIEQFADSLYLNDNTLNVDTIISDLLSLPTPFTGYETLPVLVNAYKLMVAERIYANETLQTEVVDSESDYYVESSDVVTYYQNNTEGRYDVSALIVRFINLNEANAALYQVGLKSDSKGLWYELPDIRIAEGQPGYVDLTDTVTYGYIVDILDELGLLGKLGVNYADRSKLSIADYEDYYKAYTIAKRDGYSDAPLTTEEVKAKFVEIYNLLNPAATVEIDGTGAIVSTSGEDFQTTYTYDELTDMNTSLRSHLYNTLTAETQIADPDTEKAYSSRVQTFGDFKYLVFKLDDNSADEDGILIEDPADDTAYIFNTDDSDATVAQKAQDAYDQAYADLVDGKLTSTYISSKVSEKYDAADVNIYDNILRILYGQTYTYAGSDKNKTGDVVADVNGTEITVDAFYAEVEKSYGVNLSLDLVLNKYLSNSDQYTVTDDQMADYKTQFEDIITAFSSNSYSSYPASMGREAFLLVAFGATSNEEAINQLYVYPELRDQYLTDYENHYSNDTSTIYEKFAQLAELQYNNEESISVSHLLIYFDLNADGTPDNPADVLNDSNTAEIMTGLLNLVQGYTDTEGVYHEGIYDRLGKYTDFESGLSDIANEFNDSGRILRGSFGVGEGEYIDLQPELYWSQFRQLGFNMTYETISSDITNISNFITNSSVLDTVFYDRAINIYDTVTAYQEANPTDDSLFPYLDFYDQIMYNAGITESDLQLVQSDFGWHFILADSVGEKDSAIYAQADDIDDDYINTDLNLNVYNENSDTLTASQIEYYLVLDKTDEGAPLPTVVDTAINAYLQPILTKYTGTYMQRELIFKLVADAQFADSADNARLTAIRAINRRQFNSYLLSDNGGVYDANYDALYGSWFDILES